MRFASIVLSALLGSCSICWLMIERVPAQAGNYLTYCDGHLESCESEVELVNLGLEMEYMSGLQYCPRANASVAETERASLMASRSS